MKTVNYYVCFYRPSVVCYNRYRLVHRRVPEMVLNVQSESLLYEFVEYLLARILIFVNSIKALRKETIRRILLRMVCSVWPNP